MSASMDQSDEEGLVRSPENVGSDDGTGDSLEIKPPQAKNRSSGNKKKHKRHHERKERYYSREVEADRRYPSDHRRDYRGGEEKYYKEKEYARRDPREGRKQQEQQQQVRSRRSSQDEPIKVFDSDRKEEDLRNRLIRRRQQGDGVASSSSSGMRREEAYERKSRHDDYERRHHRGHRQIDSEAEARRKKFLEVDRDESKRKERARQELEARREQHRSKEVSKSREVSLSPEPKKKRYESSEERTEAIAISSEQSGGEHGDEEFFSESDSHSSKSKESEEFEMSPIPVEQLEKSDHSSYTRSHSRDSSISSTGSSATHQGSNSKSSESESEHSQHEEDNDDDEKELSIKKAESSPKPAELSKEEEAVTNKEEVVVVENEEDKLPPYFPALQGCRSVEEFQCLNRIEEGTYGVVYRAKDKRTDEIVALKRLKMEKEKEGFPITSLREINTLLKGQHSNIVTVREIVVGSNMDKIFIVMDYVEHDLKSLMETMKHKKQVFLPAEVKCLIQQLMRAVAHLHDNWILHRDLKTSNLLLSHKGILKVGDFGLAREYGSPLKEYTSIVVTLWYRSPELLLGCKEYSTPIDVWSCGCIFAELLAMSPLFPGKSEVDQLNRIFKDLGTPNERVWPGYDQLPLVKKMTFTDYPVSHLRKKFANFTSELGLALLQGLLTYDPKQRLTADGSLKSLYFKELPLPIDPSMFPT